MIVTILVFFALIVNACTLSAYLVGIQLEVENKDCEQEIKDVKNNRLMLKLIQVFNVIVFTIVSIAMVYEKHPSLI